MCGGIGPPKGFPFVKHKKDWNIFSRLPAAKAVPNSKKGVWHMKTIGYARVSTCEQSLDLQLRALQRMKCDQIFHDHGISGATIERPGLEEALGHLSAGDKLVVWRLDRLGRSLVHLVGLINEIALRDVEFQSITENIDTGSSGGRLVFHMMAALCEFERSLISERTRAGMEAVQSRGGRVGRPPSLDAESRQRAVDLIVNHGAPVSTVAKLFKVHSRTILRAVREDTLSGQMLDDPARADSVQLCAQGAIQAATPIVTTRHFEA